MGIVVDFESGLDAMLDELEETYDGRILSPQGKVIRIMPQALRTESNGGEIFHGKIYVTTLVHGEIYQAVIETPIVNGYEDKEARWQEVREELRKLTEKIEREIAERGFIIRRGRYLFKGEQPRAAD